MTGSPKEAPRLAFGDDGSRGADVAWLWINNHTWSGWRIDVLTGATLPFPPPTWGVDAPGEARMPPWGRTYFNSTELASLQYLHFPIDPRLVLDQQRDADLVVVGHNGLSHLRSSWMGSTTEWLLHHPSAPLCVVRSAAKTQRVTCCVDGSRHAARALESFLALPLAANTEVTVLTIDDGHVDIDAATATALDMLRRVGIDATAERGYGNPTRSILEHLDAHRPDLVVLGTKGLAGWRRLRLGSTATAVAHHVTCNALIACVDDERTAEDGPLHARD